jgi:UDP-N-acetylglucosamine--N-acetylmuramyl-(pentapeptide) pyrophosphoryl-undecaprenol N-acetylglucosamine transferase
VSLSRKLRTALQLPLALARAARLVGRHRPQAVLGVGGYASGPVVLMARLRGWIGLTRAASAILEQNTVPGFTNRLLSRFVRIVFCAFPGTEGRFPGKEVIISGNPVRSAMSRQPAASRNPFTVFAFGGSQGAVGMNTLILEALPHLRELLASGRLKIIHQTGEKDFERVSKAYQELGAQARVEKFVYEMVLTYGQASLLICRAGSSTLAEIAAVGRAAILVPLPTAADNHQEKNARVFADAGAAILLSQLRSSGKELAELVRRMIENPKEVERMEAAVIGFNRPEAAEVIVERLSRD